MSRELEAHNDKVMIWKQGWFWACIAALGTVLSAAAALSAIVSNKHEVQDRTHWRLRDDLFDLAELQRLSSDSISSGTSDCIDGGCEPCSMESCLGHLALSKAYREQYQLITAEAVELASRIPDRVSAAELFQIGSALYRSGDIQQGRSYVQDAMSKDAGFTIRFRGTLLLAQVAYFERKLEEGNDYIRQTIELVESSKGHTSIERNLFKAEARLVCANMHTALGEIREARGCLENAYAELKDLPKTSFVKELENSAVTQLTIIIRQEENPKSISFEELESKLRKNIAESNDMGPPVPADGGDESTTPDTGA